MKTFLTDSACVNIRILILLVALLALPLPAPASDDPWAPRQQCLFGMPYLGHVVMPQQTGLLNEIFKLVYEPEDVLFLHERMPYTRALEDVVEGKIHVTLDVTTKRKGTVPGRAVIATYDLAIMYHHKTPYKDLSSLEGKRVAFMRGFAMDKRLPVKFKSQMVYDLSSGFHMLDRGHVDFLLGDNALLHDAMVDSQLPPGKLIMTYITSYYVRPIFTDSEEGRLLRDIYDRRMKVIIANGDFERLMEDLGVNKLGIKKVLEANQ